MSSASVDSIGPGYLVAEACEDHGDAAATARLPAVATPSQRPVRHVSTPDRRWPARVAVKQPFAAMRATRSTGMSLAGLAGKEVT
jgi:hypothetical protein